MTPQERLLEGLQELGYRSHPQAVQNLMGFCKMLLEKNKVMNLTGADSEQTVISRHILDCAAAFAGMPLEQKKILDVGCGAGFPGMPLAVLWPEAELILLDSLGKRIAFLKQCIGQLSLENVSAVQARAEEYAAFNREQYDIVTSRAVANLRVLAELCLPLVRVGGLFMAMKSTGSDAELQEAQTALHTLGGAVEQIQEYEIPQIGIRQRLLMIRKERETPGKYPRRFSKINAAPI